MEQAVVSVSQVRPCDDLNSWRNRYNVTPTAAYQYEPAYRRYGSKVNAVHFIGPNKPWSSLSGRPAGMSLPKGKEAKFDC